MAAVFSAIWTMLTILFLAPAADFIPIASLAGMLIVIAEFWNMRPEVLDSLFDEPGEHAGQMETSMMLHLEPDLVELENASEGQVLPFDVKGLDQPGVWTPSPWSKVHPDTGSGNPAGATADKGKQYIQAICEAIADLLVNLSNAHKGEVPYV